MPTNPVPHSVPRDTYLHCPLCGDGDLVAVTYAYHLIFDAGDGFGPQLMHYDWSDEYALICQSCGASAGDPDRPNLNQPGRLSAAIASMIPKKPDEE